MNQNEKERPRDVPYVAAILDYLAEHPQAMDTVDGIAEWWILRQQARVVVEGVERALEHLVEDGVLELIGAGPGARYRLKAEVLPVNRLQVVGSPLP